MIGDNTACMSSGDSAVRQDLVKGSWDIAYV